MSQPPHSTATYQLRLVLAGTSPLIWRRLLVSSETSIVQLHRYIQVAFDWSGEHLHRYHIHGKDYGIAPSAQRLPAITLRLDGRKYVRLITASLTDSAAHRR